MSSVFCTVYSDHLPQAPTNQDSIAQRTEDKISASPRIDTQSTLSVGGGIRGLRVYQAGVGQRGAHKTMAHSCHMLHHGTMH